jgi:mRNA-degrading endonuclease RelE of RelBE toxin-antitoxin system
MPDYLVKLTKTAQKQLDKLPDSIANNLIESISQFSKKP